MARLPWETTVAHAPHGAEGLYSSAHVQRMLHQAIDGLTGPPALATSGTVDSLGLP